MAKLIQIITSWGNGTLGKKVDPKSSWEARISHIRATKFTTYYATL